MADSPSAKKRIRQNIKRNARNRWRKEQVKGALKSFQQALRQGDASVAAEQLKLCEKNLDRVAATGTIHKKTASRRKSRLAKALNKLRRGKSA